ncbi:3651_t:CDS:1 [Ambispora gerdemannii]|uniref:3651_t:CDS:1 n=1 Tax=Ambispora gerdemannii TaxID=144530 RepID=A0A9N9EZY4_9GLOM|nr:3651_t:CDS:1 [Ambispora gerdemannii]
MHTAYHAAYNSIIWDSLRAIAQVHLKEYAQHTVVFQRNTQHQKSVYTRSRLQFWASLPGFEDLSARLLSQTKIKPWFKDFQEVTTARYFSIAHSLTLARMTRRVAETQTSQNFEVVECKENSSDEKTPAGNILKFRGLLRAGELACNPVESNRILDKILLVYQSMHDNNGSITSEDINSLLRTLFNLMDPYLIIEKFNLIRDQIKSENFSLSNLISLCADQSNAEELIYVFAKNSQMDADSLQQIIMAYLQIKDTDSAYKVYQKMCQIGFPPSLETFFSLVKEHLNERRTEQILNIFRDFRYSGYNFPQCESHPFYISCWRLINQLLKDRFFLKAFSIYRGLREINPNLHLVDDTFSLMETLLKNNCFDEAFSIYMEQHTRFKNKFINNIIHNFCLSPDCRHAITITKIYIDCNSKQSSRLLDACKMVILCLSKNYKLSEMIDLYEYMIDNGVKPNVETYTTIINAFAKIPDMTQAEKYYEEMIANDISPNNLTYLMLMNGYIRDKQLDKANEVFATIKKLNLPMDSSWRTLTYGYLEDNNNHLLGSCNKVLSYYTKNYALIDSVELLDEMLKANIKPDVMSYSILIDGFARVPNIEKVNEYYERMINANISPNRITYLSLLNGYVNDAKVDEAYKIFQDMRAKGIPADEKACNTIFKGFLFHRGLKETRSLLKEFSNLGFRPNIVTYNIILYHYVIKQDMQSAKDLFAKMLAKGIKPDGYTFSILINGYVREGNFAVAWEMYHEMTKFGIDLDIVLATVIFDFQAGKMKMKLKDAKQLYRDLFDVFGVSSTKLKPNIVALNAYVTKGLKKVNHPQHAYDIYRDFLLVISPLFAAKKIECGEFEPRKSKKYPLLDPFFKLSYLKPDITSFNIFIAKFALRYNDLTRALKVFEHINELRLLPDVFTYTILIEGFASRRKMGGALVMYNEMKRNGVKPNVYTYTSLIKGWAKINNKEKSQQIYKEMRDLGLLPTKGTYWALRSINSSASYNNLDVDEESSYSNFDDVDKESSYNNFSGNRDNENKKETDNVIPINNNDEN